jgi:4-hydroxybenzoate polyprenyltransferase
VACQVLLLLLLCNHFWAPRMQQAAGVQVFGRQGCRSYGVHTTGSCFVEKAGPMMVQCNWMAMVVVCDTGALA